MGATHAQRIDANDLVAKRGRLTKRIVVVGFGSIGQRHTRVLRSLGCDVAVVSAREGVDPNRHADLGSCLRAFDAEAIVVANRTAEHERTLSHLESLGFTGSILVEKPLFAEPPSSVGPQHRLAQVHVLYNLRFHPILRALREHISGATILNVRVDVGQWLPSWRPSADYRQSYSAHKSQGGGVLRDLSHELDYLTWTFGACKAVVARVEKRSALDITSDDTVDALMSLELCPQVNLHMNYLDRTPRRMLVVNTHEDTWHVDFIGKTLHSQSTGTKLFDVDPDQTYTAMHGAWLSGEFADLCSYDEGLGILNLIAAFETSQREAKWVWNL